MAQTFFRAPRGCAASAWILLIGMLLLPSSSLSQAQMASDGTGCQESARKEIELAKAARQTDGLHKAALLNGGFYSETIDGLPWNQAGSLKDLARGSDAILVGHVEDMRSELSKDGRDISTRYTIRIEESLKGTQRAGSTIDLLLPGGRITFADGSVAVETATKQLPLLKDHRYTLFAASSDAENGVRPAFADQGVCELDFQW